jgi:hypothetical protein
MVPSAAVGLISIRGRENAGEILNEELLDG